MPEWVWTILFILLFIFCLSILIVVHEAGHLSAAKAFNVYCREFSVGFGPALLHKKRKNGETYFSIRAIPFGGYVSMVGEDIKDAEDSNDKKDEKEEPEIVVPKERTLPGISKWKRAIIMVAGVAMNAVLAIIIFFCSQMFFTQRSFIGLNVVSIAPESAAAAAGLKDNDYIDCKVDERNAQFAIFDTNLHYYQAVDPSDPDPTKDTEIFFYSDPEKQHKLTSSVVLSSADISFNERNYDKFLNYYINTFNNKGELVPDYGNKIDFSSDTYKDVDYVLMNFRSFVGKGDEKKFTDHKIINKLVSDSGKKAPAEVGISVYLYEHDNNFAEAVQGTFVDFGNSATAVFRGIGALFTTPDGWKNTSGIIGIGFTMSKMLKNYGVGMFIHMWGLISVNLAIFNLLPFPGLDGWHLLVLAVEGIFRKEIPNKVKNIISAIGVLLLLGLMILILFKDVFAFII